MGHIGTVSVFDINDDDATLSQQKAEPSLVIETKSEGSKATVAGWSGDGDYIIVGHDNGYVSKYDSKTGKLVTSLQAHGIHNEEKRQYHRYPIRPRRQIIFYHIFKRQNRHFD